jgi:hypothetical protein
MATRTVASGAAVRGFTVITSLTFVSVATADHRLLGVVVFGISPSKPRAS